MPTNQNQQNPNQNQQNQKRDGQQQGRDDMRKTSGRDEQDRGGKNAPQRSDNDGSSNR